MEVCKSLRLWEVLGEYVETETNPHILVFSLTILSSLCFDDECCHEIRVHCVYSICKLLMNHIVKVNPRIKGQYVLLVLTIEQGRQLGQEHKERDRPQLHQVSATHLQSRAQQENTQTPLHSLGLRTLHRRRELQRKHKRLHRHSEETEQVAGKGECEGRTRSCQRSARTWSS